MNTNEKTTADGAAESGQATETVQVLCRFYRHELDEMREDTGANADATAVACFARKNLRKRG